MVIRKDILRLCIPIIAEQTFTVSMGMVNTMMAGHISPEAVSAVGMIDSINNILIAFFAALAVGGTVVVAHYIGQNNNNNANEAAKQALLAGLIISLVITIMIWIFRYPIIDFLYGSADKSVLNDAVMYLGITLITYPLIALTSISCGILRGAGDTKTPMTTTIIMNIVNIVLGYILIFGIQVDGIRLPGFEIKGAAVAIAIARTLGAVLILYALVRGSKVVKLSNIYSIKINMEMQKSIFGIGIPASVESLLFFGGKLITQVFVVGMGTITIAAHSIAGSVITMINIPGTAMNLAATAIVGQAMGRGDSEQAEKDLIYIVKLSTVGLLVCCAIAFPLSNLISLLYTQDYGVMKLSALLIRITVVCTPIIWPTAFILNSGFKGAGDVRYTLVTSISSMWICRVGLGYVLAIPLKMGVIGVWMGMYIDWLLRGILYYFRMKSGKWKNHIVVKSEEGI